jgi:hypothetical protein
MKIKHLLLFGIAGITVIITASYIINNAENEDNRVEIPKVYSNIKYDASGKMYFEFKKEKYYLSHKTPEFVFSDFDDIETGTDKGILLTFKKRFEGKVLYGLFPDEKTNFPKAIFFKKYAVIKDGKALLDIERLHGKYDIANWEKKGYGRLEYRILTADNRVIVNKKINFRKKENFLIAPTVVTGPILSQLTDKSVVITCYLNVKSKFSITVNGRKYTTGNTEKHHEILVDGLKPATEYTYTLDLEEFSETHKFRTAPKAGSKEEFTFAFASDSRGGLDVGITNTYGTNAMIMEKLASFLTTKNIAFWQFTGDMISGYKTNDDRQRLEYTNWYRVLSNYLYSIPLNVGAGNHEAHLHVFDFKNFYSVDKFPFATHSAEALFAEMTSNPLNGPESEDGSSLDPDPENIDFPTYKENVYSYTYGNTAMIVLNSNYLYTPSSKLIKIIGGNAHGYVMDNQLKWLEKQLAKFENDKNIDHVFVTIHTPAFPNGGHANNDMWYKGNNIVRPYIAGKPAEKGILERRDEFIDLLVNKSSKFRVLLTGDEHNYSRLTVTNQTDIYPAGFEGERLKLNRPFVQIVDGSAGAPYYGQETLPWTPSVDKFTAQYAVVLFHVNGKSIEIEVVNPDTFEVIEKVKLL